MVANTLTREDLYLRALRSIWEGLALESPQIDKTLATFLDPTVSALDLSKAEKESLRDLLEDLHTEFWGGLDPYADAPKNSKKSTNPWVQAPAVKP